MNWVQENKFLTGFIGVMVIGIGVLGFKVYSASSALEEATNRYTAKASRYNSLRRLAPYPNRANLAVFEKQKSEAAEVITEFQTDLAKREFPLEPMSPEQFQDRLKKAVTEIRAKAAAANVKLPDKFYLGFDRYETAPPDKDAAALLGRELKAIEWVLQQLIAAPVVELKTLVRPEIAEEKGRATSTPARANPARSGGDRGGRGGRADLVSSHSFDIVIVCKQRQFANILNAVISPKAPQFFIPRSIRVTNQSPKGPPRTSEVETPAVDPSVAASPEAPKPTGDIQYIVGEELIEAALRLEIVDFAEPGAARAAK